jgi:hypothetical protein
MASRHRLPTTTVKSTGGLGRESVFTIRAPVTLWGNAPCLWCSTGELEVSQGQLCNADVGAQTYSTWRVSAIRRAGGELIGAIGTAPLTDPAGRLDGERRKPGTEGSWFRWL